MFVLPYSVKLYEQTGCSLLVTHFRIGDYVVEKVNPGFLSDGGGFGESYEHIYKNRRAERMLNSAGTEMVGYEVDSGAGMHNVLSAAFARMFLAPGELLNSFWSNIKLLVDVVGWPLFMLFFVSFLSSFFVRVNEKVDRLRSFSVIFLLVYMLSVTFLAGGLVGRYIEVVFPFVVIFVVVEFYVFLHYLKKDSSFNIYFIFFSFLLLLSIPKYSFFVTYDQKNTEKGMPHRFCSPLVTYNSPVFTVSSFDSYFLGAWYRALPNDSLGRVAQYADRTGVDWLLLISDSPQYNYQYSLYTNSPWLRNIKNLQDYYPDIVRLRCSVNDQLWLYEFL
ncbi:MAG: hypothetical protein Kow0089_09730 [Desulfobulbaceae bacterium]